LWVSKSTKEGRHTNHARLTSDVAGTVGELLDLVLCEDTQDDDEVLAFFEALVGFLQRFGVDEAAIDLGPACTWWNALFVGL
jgi:hypothetical protein